MKKKEYFIDGSYRHTLTAPESWEFLALSELVEIIGGSQPPKSDFSNEFGEGLIRLIQIRDYKSENYKVYIPIEKAKRFCNKDDIMIGRYGPPIFQILRGLEGAYNVALMKAKPKFEFLDLEYLFRYLENQNIYNYVESASDRTAGQSGVNKKHLEKYPIPLAPNAEQKQIATKLNELLAQVDTIKTRLDAIPTILKHFRQSVLAATVSGKLTENIGEFQNVQVTEPWAHEVEAPAHWDKYQFSEVVKIIGGSQPPKSEFKYKEGKGLIRLIQIRDYKSDAHLVYIPIDRAKRFCTKDEIMIGRYGPPIFQILRGLEGAYNVVLMKAEPNNELLDKEYLYWFLQNYKLYHYIEAGSDRTAGQSGVNKKFLELYPIYVPPMVEQEEIVRRVEKLLTFADQVEQRVKEAQIRVNSLTQSILAKAFRGELTAEWREQNPDLISGENSAEALLQRIKAECESIAPKKHGRKAKA